MVVSVVNIFPALFFIFVPVGKACFFCCQQILSFLIVGSRMVESISFSFLSESMLTRK